MDFLFLKKIPFRRDLPTRTLIGQYSRPSICNSTSGLDLGALVSGTSTLPRSKREKSERNIIIMIAILHGKSTPSEYIIYNDKKNIKSNNYR